MVVSTTPLPASPDGTSPEGSASDGLPAARRTARPRPAVVALALLADLACVLGLALGGRAAHEAGSPWEAVLRIVWPFAVGAAVGWVVTRGWRRPTAVWPTGLAVWVAAWGLGVVLRMLTGQGVAPAFQLVSFAFLAVTVLGWRGVVLLVQTLAPGERRRRRAALAGR